MSELGINNVGIQQNYSASESKPQKKEQTQQKNSIFGDYNNNGTVDKSDFKNASLAQMAEEKGLIGKAWDAVQDIVKNLTTSGGQEPMSKLSQDDRQSTIEDLKKYGTEYKENPDGSIEFVQDGIKTLCSWSGNTLQMHSVCPNGNLVHSDYNLETKEGKDTVINSDGTLKQEISYGGGKEDSVKNYILNESGEMIETNKFIGVDYSNGEMYTGVDIAKMFGDDKYNLTTIEDAEKFFRSITQDFSRIDGFRNGSIVVSMEDGTTIEYERPMLGLLGYDTVTITKDGEVLEKYNTKGEAIEE